MDNEIKQDISKLFQAFDQDHDGEITSNEIFKTMRSMGYNLDLKEAENMIRKVSTKNSIGPNEFHDLMRPIMLDHIFSTED